MEWYWWVIIGLAYGWLLLFFWCLAVMSSRGEK